LSIFQAYVHLYVVDLYETVKPKEELSFISFGKEQSPNLVEIKVERRDQEECNKFFKK